MTDEERDRDADLHVSRYARKYFPTFAELVDRMQILQLKEVFFPEDRAAEYRAERALVEHDLDLLLRQREREKGQGLSASTIHAISVLMLTNRYIWENESRARQGGDEQDKLLKLTHSINGVRNAAKNAISREFGERWDHKIDCFAEKLMDEFGNWRIFDANSK